MKVALLFIFIAPIFAVVIVNHFKIETNLEVANATLVIKRVRGRGSVANLTITSYATVDKLKLYLKISLDDNSQLNGNKEFVNTVFDIEKVFAGIYSNPIARALCSNLIQSMDFKPKFPFVPGTYKMINLSIDDSFVPLLSSVSGQADLRLFGRILGRKSQIFIGNATLKGELIRGSKAEE